MKYTDEYVERLAYVLYRSLEGDADAEEITDILSEGDFIDTCHEWIYDEDNE